MSINLAIKRTVPKTLTPYVNAYAKYKNDKDQKIANLYLDKIEKAKSKNEQIRLQEKLKDHLEEVAPPTNSQICQLHRLSGKILDEGYSDEEKDKMIRVVFNAHIPLPERIEQIKKYRYANPPTYVTSSKITMPAKGIPNLGNTCFMNTGFQLIMHNPELRNALVSTYKELLTQKDIPADKLKAYKAFLNAVISYENGSVHKIDLNALRTLFLDSETQRPNAMGDVTEFMSVILEPLDSKKNPHLFCKVVEVKTYVPAFFLTQEEEKILEKKNKDLKLHRNDLKWIERELTTLPIDGVLKKVESFSSLMLPVPETKESVLGQKLVDEFFSLKSSHMSENSAFKQENEVQYFSSITTQNILESAPPYLNISFNRYRNDGSKITTKVKMPEEMIVPTKKGTCQYKLEQVAIHSGAHYFALLKKNGAFVIANDSQVHKASSGDLDQALANGYMYVYKKV